MSMRMLLLLAMDLRSCIRLGQDGQVIPTNPPIVRSSFSCHKLPARLETDCSSQLMVDIETLNRATESFRIGLHQTPSFDSCKRLCWECKSTLASELCQQ